MSPKLFAIYLGGRAPKCNTELHDVVFVAGERIEDTYEQLMDKWLGTPKGLHLDSYMEVDVADGYRVALSATAPVAGKKLFFINLGAYAEGVFGELHATKLIVAENMAEAKVRGKAALAGALPPPAHTDDLFELDDCLEVDVVGALHVVLEPTDRPENFKPINGYHLVPKAIVEEYIARKGIAA